MNSPLLPRTGPSGPVTHKSPEAVSEDDPTAFVTELGASHRPLTIGARTSGPPSELLEQIADAASLQQQLGERGEELRFSEREQGGVSIALYDSIAMTSRNVSVGEAFAIAAGESPE
jgi:hypothetical protein